MHGAYVVRLGELSEDRQRARSLESLHVQLYRCLRSRKNKRSEADCGGCVSGRVPGCVHPCMFCSFCSACDLAAAAAGGGSAGRVVGTADAAREVLGGVLQKTSSPSAIGNEPYCLFHLMERSRANRRSEQEDLSNRRSGSEARGLTRIASCRVRVVSNLRHILCQILLIDARSNALECHFEILNGNRSYIG